MRRGALVLMGGLLLVAPVALAQTAKAWDDTKPAWQWTLEERLAKRFDPAQLEARIALDIARAEAAPPMTFLMAPSKEETIRQIREMPYINGGETPELFTPLELFLVLLDNAYPSDGRDQSERRSMVEEKAAALGFGADLWNRLGRVSARYLELRREHQRLAMAEQSGASASKRVMGPLTPEVFCKAQTDALAAAKAEFGEELLLRLLYEVVAPPLSTPVFTEEKVRFHERGCRET